jgi:hypothetical protein
MLLDNPTYRNEIDLFNSAMNNKDFNALKERMHCSAFSYLFTIKPEIKNQLEDAISKNDISRVIELIRSLFTE